jgi:hypothetical protein
MKSGAKIQRIRYASNETNSRKYQTGGPPARGSHPVMPEGWPRTLDELEALKSR